jgi:hypothetical protein
VFDWVPVFLQERCRLGHGLDGQHQQRQVILELDLVAALTVVSPALSYFLKPRQSSVWSAVIQAGSEDDAKH